MTDQDRYIPGVPCWIDTTQPDPDAAAEFYGQLFGWELEDVMPPGSPGKYLIGRIRGGDVAAVASQQEARRRRPTGTRTSGWPTPTRRPARSAPPAAPCSASRWTSWRR